VSALSASAAPLVHVFAGLSRIEKESRVECALWLSVRPGETQIGARLGKREVVILSKPGPLFLEDEFPVKKSAIKDHQYILFDKSGTVLASVPIGNLLRH
jgi:hypothetical protein